MANKFQIELVADTATEFPAGGIPANEGGTYMLNLCNDSDAEVAVSAIYLTTGGAPTAADKVEPSRTIEAKGSFALYPIPIGVGWKLVLQASAPISVGLIGVEKKD